MNKGDVIKTEVNEIVKTEVVLNAEHINDDIIDRVTDISGIQLTKQEESEIVAMVDDISITTQLSISKEEMEQEIQSQSVPTLDKL